MERSFRSDLIRLVTFLGGVYFFLEFILPVSVLESVGVEALHEDISYGFIVFSSMAMGLGLINLFLVHGSRIIFQRKDWMYSFVLLIGLVCMMSSTVMDWRGGQGVADKARPFEILREFSDVIERDSTASREDVPPLEIRTEALRDATFARIAELRANIDQKTLLTFSDQEELYPLGETYIENLREILSGTEQAARDVKVGDFSSSQALAASLAQVSGFIRRIEQLNYDHSLTKKTYDFLYQGLFVSLGSAMFSLLGVYIAAAAYRAFRIRSFESSLMMVAAVLVMLGQIPFYVYISEDLPAVRQWLMEVPNSAAFRAIRIGAAIAGLVMAFRMWLSIESGSFSKERRG